MGININIFYVQINTDASDINSLKERLSHKEIEFQSKIHALESACSAKVESQEAEIQSAVAEYQTVIAKLETECKQ